MGDRLQSGEAQKAAGAFDCMNRPEDAPEQSRILRMFLQLHQLLVEPREILVTFHQKLADHFQIFHPPLSQPQNIVGRQDPRPNPAEGSIGVSQRALHISLDFVEVLASQASF